MTTQQHEEVLNALAALHADMAVLHADTAGIQGELRDLRASIGQLDAKLDQTRNHLSAQIERVYQELSGRIGDLERIRPRRVPGAGRP